MHLVAAGLLVKDGRCLLAHRRSDRAWYPACWDLVGGHVEPGEQAYDALARECREELAIDVLDAEPARTPLEFGDPDVEASVFIVTEWLGTPTNAAPDEHDRIAWFKTAELDGGVR